MKKSVLSLTLLICFSGFTTLFSGAGPSYQPCSIASLGWKRAWQCRNMKGKDSVHETKKRLAQNKCTDCEISAGKDLMALMISEAAVGVVGVGGFAWLTAIEKREEKKKRERIERLERQAKEAITPKLPVSPLYEPPPEK